MGTFNIYFHDLNFESTLYNTITLKDRKVQGEILCKL